MINTLAGTMLFIKPLVLIFPALFVYSCGSEYNPHSTDLIKRQTSGSRYSTSCPHTFVKEMPFDLYDSYHNYVKIDQRGRGQFFYFAKCRNDTGPPACPSCCIGTDTTGYATECKKILGLQSARVCLNRWCSQLSQRWVYIDTGCACYFEPRPATT